MKREYGLFAAVGVTVGLALFGAGLRSVEAQATVAPRIIHPGRPRPRVIRPRAQFLRAGGPSAPGGRQSPASRQSPAGGPPIVGRITGGGNGSGNGGGGYTGGGGYGNGGGYGYGPGGDRPPIGGSGTTTPGSGPGRPRVPVRGGGDWRPHLEFALEALQSAGQALHTSPTPDVSDALRYLNTAYLELQRLPPIFDYHRANAMKEVQGAMHHLTQNPPKPGALSLIAQAFANAQKCKQMYP